MVFVWLRDVVERQPPRPLTGASNGVRAGDPVSSRVWKHSRSERS